MIKVSPSILSADFVNLQRDIDMIARVGADYLHVDVMDGIFVPNITIGIPVVKAIRRVTQLPLDVHLMIDRPIRYVEKFCGAGADLLTLHAEADSLENNLRALDLIHACGVRSGVSVKPDTPADALTPYLSHVDLILMMTVEPGFGGQRFRADLMPKLREIRAMIDRSGRTIELEVDGGVNLETAGTCTQNGANVLVAGSAFFRAPDPAAFVASLKRSAE